MVDANRVALGALSMQISLLKTVGIMAVFLALAACTTTPRLPPASEEEQSASVAKFVTCLDKNVAKVDDRVSDASTIAAALVEGPCAADYAASKETYTRNMSDRERIMFEAKLTTTHQVAVDIVLRHRKGAKAPARTSPQDAPSKRMQGD